MRFFTRLLISLGIMLLFIVYGTIGDIAKLTKLIKKEVNYMLIGNKVLPSYFPLPEVLVNANVSVKKYVRFIDGILINTDGDFVESISAGSVTFIGHINNLGEVVIVKGVDNLEYVYGFLETSNVKLYQVLEVGTVIGKIDNDSDTDYYLYYLEIRYDSLPIDLVEKLKLEDKD